MLYQPGTIRRASDAVQWGDYRFEAVAMEGDGIDQLLVRHVPAPVEAVDASQEESRGASWRADSRLRGQVPIDERRYQVRVRAAESVVGARQDDQRRLR
jgi:hypothetical protein